MSGIGLGAQALGRRWFEIQVRSILDHAWSEIEHEVIYKAGVRYPAGVRRRFMAVAGSLEVLEDAFAALTVERDKLVEAHVLAYSAGRDMEARFDVARLVAFLEIRRPSGMGWRDAERNGQPFPAPLATSAVEALASSGLGSPRKLDSVLRTARFRDRVTNFAALERIAPEEVSHLAVVVLAVAVMKPKILHRQFPEMLFSPSVSAIVGSHGAP